MASQWKCYVGQRFCPAVHWLRNQLHSTAFISETMPITCMHLKRKGKGFPYSLPSVGPAADPGVQTVSPQVTISQPPGGRLPLLSARPAVTFPAAKNHRPLAGTKLYCLVTEAHRCEQFAQGCYTALPRAGFEPTTCWLQVQRSTRCATALTYFNTALQNRQQNTGTNFECGRQHNARAMGHYNSQGET